MTTTSYIPQRIKRSKQQITVKLYQDQLDMLDRYGRFIDDSREYIITQALELVFKKDKEFVRWLEQQAALSHRATEHQTASLTCDLDKDNQKETDADNDTLRIRVSPRR